MRKSPGSDQANDPALERLQREVDELRRQLVEAQEMIRAIQNHEVDAVVVTDADAEHPRVFTLAPADRPYRLLVERMQQGAATLTVDGVVLYCNERFAALLHYPLEVLVGRSIQELVDVAHRPLLQDLLRDALNAGVEGEVTFCRGDGRRASVLIGVTALREGAAGVCMIVADMTERKWRERLVADEALARSILEQVADAVVVCDRAGTVVQASRAAHELCGTSPIGKPFEQVFQLRRVAAASTEPTPVDVSPAWQGEALRGWEVTFAQQGGARADLLLNAGPLVAGSDLLGTVITLTDITPLRQAEDELRRRAAALQEADQRKDELLAMLAHELRNPLSPIQSSLEIMRLREVDDPQLRKSRDVIARQVQQLSRLVDDLLEVSRIRRGKIHLRMERIDLASAVIRAEETCRPMIDARGHHLTVLLPDAPIWVLADLTRLAQVLGNLLNNAAKYTEDGGRIVVQARQEGAEAVIRVRDTGIGIPPHLLSEVFELFIQVHHSLDRSQGGLGIGLALVKQLVAMHGGRVEARSAGIGRGAEFVVRLLIAGAEDVEAIVDPPGGDLGALGQHLRVLVIDDNEDAAETLAELLGMLGHEVRVARDGPSGIEAALEFRPAVVLCDIGLPRLDGYQVASRLRAMQEVADVRLVALTGYGREEDVQRSLAAGFHAHLVKPFDLEKLEAALGVAR